MDLPELNPREWEAVVFAEHPQHDTVWAIELGHDGHVYLGLCLEGKGGGVAQLYRYDTQARVLQHLADMGAVTGEPPDSGHATQGKIHFSLCSATDGKVYGATHCTTPPIGQTIWSPIAMWGDPVASFPGGHIFRHDTLTGETVDFGVITPHDGIPYLMLDEARGRLYGVTYPKAHFFRCNLVGRDLVDYGRVSAMYPIAMVFDRQGNLYTSDINSRLIKYDVARDRLIHLATMPYTEPWNRSARYSWVSDMTLGPDGLIYGVTYSNDHLFRFDPEQYEPRLEDLGPGLGDWRAGALRCLIPDRAGHLYYLAISVWDGSGASVLARYDVATGQRAPVAELILAGERYTAWRGVCDASGALYFGGLQRLPNSILIYRPQGKG